MDAGRLKDRCPAHEYLAEMFSFPAYYGKNLDALYDCLMDLCDCRIVMLHLKDAEISDTYGEKIISVLEDAAQDNPKIVYDIK